MGFTERWRRQCVGLLTQLPKNAAGYDLMAGTGEIWPHLLERFPDIASIIAVDISSGMHKKALTRLKDMRADKIDFIEDDLLQTQLADNSADFIVSTFGLKTFNPSQHKKLARLIASKLKHGGSFAMIEASDPKGWILRPLYLFHLKGVLPLIEKILLRGATDFKMLGQYSTRFGDAAELGELLRNEGLDVTFKKHFFGCATSVSGVKPPKAPSK